MGKNCSPLKGAIGKVFASLAPKSLVKVTWNAVDGTRTKPMQFDVSRVDDHTIYDSVGIKGNLAVALSNLNSIITSHNPETYKKLHANLKAAGKRNLALLGSEELGGSDSDSKFNKGEMIKFKSIAIHEILSAMASEPNIQANMNIEDDEATELFNNDGSRNLNLVPIRQVIGQKMLGHMNEHIMKVRGDSVYASDTHAKLGQIIIDELIKDGVIKVEKDGTVLNPSYVEDTDTHNSREMQITKDKQFLTGFPVVSLNLDMFLDEEDKGNTEKADTLRMLFEEGNTEDLIDTSRTASETVNGTVAVHRMVVPSNEKAPVYGDETVDQVRVKDLGNSKSADFREMPPEQQKRKDDLSKRLKVIDKKLNTINKNKNKSKLDKSAAVDLAETRTMIRKEIQQLNREYRGTGITQNHKDLMNELSAQEARINPFVTNLMLSLQNRLTKDKVGTDPEITLRKILSDMGFKSTADQNMIFGMFGGSTNDDFKRKIGQSISKTNPLLQLVMNFNNFIDEKRDSKTFKHEVEVYRTTRMGYLATFMNEQMDKNFARAMTESAYAQEFEHDSELFTDMVATMRDQGLDVPMKAIQEHGYHRGLDYAIDFILENRDENGLMSTESTSQILKWARAGSFGPEGLKVPVSSSGPFTTASLLYAAADIRESNGETIKTHFRSKFDAAGSGIMITAYQAIGKYSDEAGKDKIYELLQNMGYIQDGKFDENEFNKLLDSTDEKHKKLVKDVYHILLNGMKEAAKTDKDAADALKVMETLESMGIFRSLRDLVKPMTMITNYQAGDFTAVHGTAAELRATVTEHLINSSTAESLAYIKTMIKEGNKEFYDDNEIESKSAYEIANTVGINSAIESFFVNGLAAKMRGEIESSMLPMFTDYKNNIKGAFGLIESAYAARIDDGSDDTITIGILPAITKLTMPRAESREYSAFERGDFTKESDKARYNNFMKHHRKMLRKYSMPMTSKRQMVRYDKDGKPWTIVLAEEPNGLTPSVNSIHGIDAAIFFLSHMDTINELKQMAEKGNKAAKIALKNANGMIHDANNGDLFYNNVYKKHYRKNSVMVNENYDIQHELALTYASFEGKSDSFSDFEAEKALTSSLEGIKKKTSALGDVSQTTYRHFGFMGKKDFDTNEKEKYGELKKYDENAKPTKEEVTAPVKDSPGVDTSGEPILYEITKGKAKRAYMSIRAALKFNKPFVIFDVETNGHISGKRAPGKYKVNPSEVHEIAITKMTGKDIGETKTFYFDVKTIDDEARAIVFPNTKSSYEASNIMQQRFKDQGLKKNKDVIKAIEDYVGSDEMFAYNAKFDYASLDIMNKKHGGSMDLNPDLAEENDLLAASLWVKSNEGKEEINRGEGENVLESMYRDFAKGKEDWNSDLAHGAEYDTKRTADLVSAFGEDIDSGKLKSNDKTSKKATKSRTKAEVKSLVDKWKKEDTPLGKFLTKFGDVVFAEESAYDHVNDIIELTTNGDLTEAELKQELNHEISHQKTTGYWGDNPKDRDVSYISKHIDTIKNKRKSIFENITDPVIQGRIDKFLAEPNNTRAALEFIAIMDAEPDVRAAMNDAIGNVSIALRTKRVLQNIAKWFGGKGPDDFDFSAMLKSVDNIVTKGEAYNNNSESTKSGREKSASSMKSNEKLYAKKKTRAEVKEAFDKQLKVGKNKAYNESKSGGRAAKDLPGFYQWNIINNESGELVQRMLYNLEPYADGFIDDADKWLEENFDIYKKNKMKMKSIWEGNDTIQSFKGYMNRPRLGRHDLLSAFETIQMNAEQDAKEFRDKQIVAMNKLIDSAKLDGKKLTKENIAELTEVSAKSAIFHLANKNGDFARIINSDDHMAEIEKMIKEIEDTISLKLRAKHAEQIGMVLAGKLNAENSEYYNVEQMRISSKKDRSDVSKLVSLYALKHNTSTDNGIKIMKQNEDLKKSLIATSIALQELTASVIDGTTDKLGFKESLVHDYFENPKEIIAVNTSDIASNRYSSKNGWKIIREPKGNDYGLMQRDRSSTTRQSGAGTTENFSLYDIIVPDEIFNKDAKNAIKIKTLRGTRKSYHKMALTKEELATFSDNVMNPADLLIRSHAQMMMVKDTQSVRDYIMYKDMITVQKTKKTVRDFEHSLRKMKVEKRPWFIKIPKGMNLNEYLDANPRIRLYYKIPDYVSTVGDFNKSFDLVRKDLNDMMLGYKDIEMFEGNQLGKDIMFATRQTVLMVKGHWIAQNPAKIANDIVSNNIILSLKGVPFKDMIANQSRAIKLSKQMSNLRAELIALEFEVLKAKHTEGVDKVKELEAKRDKLITKIEDHEFAPLYKNGMIQSMSTEILKKDESVVTGLQHNVENIFNYILEDSKGKPSNIAKGVQWFADAGWSVDQLAVWLGESAQNVDMFDGFVKEVGQNLKESGKRVRKKKKDEDMAKYLSEFIGSPDSEISRIGSYVVHMSDIAARYTLYKHLKNNPKKFDAKKNKKVNMTESQIVTEVLDSFVDYKVNMPKELKFVSDHGILLFPSFWLRIQKVMYVLAKESPAKVGTGLLFHEAFGLSAASYYDSNIFSKMGEIVNLPPSITDPMDVFLPVDFLQDITAWL